MTDHPRLDQDSGVFPVVADERLDAVRQLAGGLAHDLNNLLAGIMGYADLIDHLAEDETLTAYAGRINRTVERAADILRLLTLFARQGPFHPRQVSLRDLAGEVIAGRTELPDGVRVLVDPNAAPGSVNADPEQVRVAIDALVDNAIRALAGRGGEVVVGIVPGAEARLLRVAGLPGEGDWVTLTVSDDGPGVPAAIRGRVTEPFFTTREVGQGNGMGLAAVEGIARRHRGRIVCDDEVVGGAMFHLVLPRDAGPGTTTVVHRPARQRRTGRILLVEDEPTVAETMAILLRSLGYEVIRADDGPSGLARFEEARGGFDLVLLDVKLPRMNGDAVLASLREIDADVPCVVMTGHALDTTATRMLELGACDVLFKPVSLDRLRAALDGVLGLGESDASPVEGG